MDKSELYSNLCTMVTYKQGNGTWKWETYYIQMFYNTFDACINL